MQDIFFVPDFNSMSGVIAALKTNNYISVLGENIYQFSFSFIAPLRSDPDMYLHFLISLNS